MTRPEKHSCRRRGAHIGIELPHKAGKVVVLEESRQELPREGLIFPYRETAPHIRAWQARAHRHGLVSFGVIRCGVKSYSDYEFG